MNKFIELIVSDMDGCLLDSHKNPPETIHQLIDELKTQNILFGICSGRQYASIHEKMNQRNDILYIGENGGICVYQNETLYFNALPSESIEEFVSLAQTIECVPVLCGKDTAYVSTSDPQALQQIQRFYESYAVVEDLLSIHEPFCKISVLDLKGSEANCYPYFKKYEQQFEIIVSDSIWMDIVSKGQSKGSTLKKAAEKLEKNLDKAVAFGDYFNDVEMLQAVNYSFAMENAHEGVKQQAKYIAPSNDDNGVVKTIELLLRKAGEQK